MEKISHPVSGENGYFYSEMEKTLIDAILSDYRMNQLVTTSHSMRGGVDEQSRANGSFMAVVEYSAKGEVGQEKHFF